MGKPKLYRPLPGDIDTWTFTEYVTHHRRLRRWNYAEISRRCDLSGPEISRAETGERKPTLRIVCEFSRAFSSKSHAKDDCQSYADWLVLLAALGERARTNRPHPRR